MKPRVLITGAGYFDTPEKANLLFIWARLIEYHSADCDVVVLDCCGPLKASAILPGYDAFDAEEYSPPIFGEHTRPLRRVYRMPTNQGHPLVAEEPMRDSNWMIGTAIANGYDYHVGVEADCLLVRPVRQAVDLMEKTGVRFTMPFEMINQFAETQIVIAHVPWLKSVRFAERMTELYRPKELMQELLLEKTFKDDLFWMPWRGFRNDCDSVTPENLRQTLRHGCDFISHCKDFRVYVEFLAMNGLAL